MKERLAVFLNEASTGYRVQARRLILRTADEVLEDWYEFPYSGSYRSDREIELDGGGKKAGRFLIWINDEQFSVFTKKLHENAIAEGWSGNPFDAYHD